MKEIGLANVAIEPFMDHGMTWDNEHFSLYMLEPDYQPLTGFPLTHTAGTNGRIVCPVFIIFFLSSNQCQKPKGKCCLEFKATMRLTSASLNAIRF